MITYLRGDIVDLKPTSLVVECNGVGYLVNISLTTYTTFQDVSAGKILITQLIREDAHLLYGFATEAERELFGLLIGVSGIGPNTARVILSQYNPRELNTILTLGQVEPLKAVKGIGLKTAQRIVLELKGKLPPDEEADITSPAMQAHGALPINRALDEAVGALRMLGFPEAPAHKVVFQLMKDEPGITVEELIKQALKQL